MTILVLASCDQDTDKLDNSTGEIYNVGTLEFDFAMPPTHLPSVGVHRVSLNLSYSVDSLYKQQYFKMANVSDYQRVYHFHLPVGEYYWMAGITCSCGGDTCLWGGFPGGQWGKRFTFDKFAILEGNITRVRPKFDR